MDRQRILVVDDDEKVLQVCAQFLEKTAVQVVVASSAEEALRILESEDIAVVASDYSMSGMNGSDLLEHVRQQFPDVARILFTGIDDPRIAEEATRRGEILRFLVKPFQGDAFREAVDRACTESRRLRARSGSSGRGEGRTRATLQSGIDAYARQERLGQSLRLKKSPAILR